MTDDRDYPIFVEVIVSYHPTDEDEVGCDGLYKKESKIVTKEIEIIKRIAWKWCYENHYMATYNPDLMEMIDECNIAITALGGLKKSAKEKDK